MAQIDKLTPEQEIELERYYQERLEIGRSIKPLDHTKVESIINRFYTKLGMPIPEYRYYPSPHAVLEAYKGQVSLNDYFGGQQWGAWKAFYDFARKIGVEYSPEDNELLDLWLEESEHLHWWFPYEGLCLIVERPIRMSLNAAGAFHNEKEKALEFADGWGFYALNGIVVPEYLVVTPEEDLDPAFFTKEQNADVKAEFVRKFGVERMLHMGKKIDSHEKYGKGWWTKSEYELWDMAVLFPGLDYQPYLKMLNQTTGIWHVEAVSPECRDLPSAIKERLGGDYEIVSIA